MFQQLKGVTVQFGFVSLTVVLLALSPAHSDAQIAPGTVMVSVGSGDVQEWSPGSPPSLITTINVGIRNSFTTGSMFDVAGNFFVTGFDSQEVTKFDPSGTLIGNFGSGYNANPESIIRNLAGNIFIGQALGSHEILEFDSTGVSIGSFAPAIENVGTDWIDLDGDQCTIFYTSEGAHVKRFNVCTSTQLSDFNPTALPGSYAFALRIRPTGDVLVADFQGVVRLDPSGVPVNMYTLSGPNGAENCLFALSLDPNGTSFWTADFCTADVLKVDINSGNVVESFNTGTGFQTVFGLSVKGEITAATTNQCPLTQGFWKNHSEAWPVTSLTLGSVTYTQSQLLTLLNTPPKGDASLTLAHQLIAANLNIDNGSTPAPIVSTITDANNLLAAQPGSLPYHILPSSGVGRAMVNDARTLASYNEGLLTPNCTPAPTPKSGAV